MDRLKKLIWNTSPTPPYERQIRNGPGKKYFRPFSPLEYRGMQFNEVVKYTYLNWDRMFINPTTMYRPRSGAFFRKVFLWGRLQANPYGWGVRRWWWRLNKGKWPLLGLFTLTWFAFPGFTTDQKRVALTFVPEAFVPGGKPPPPPKEED